MRYRRADLRARVAQIREKDPELRAEIDHALTKTARPAWVSDSAGALNRLSWDEPRTVTEAVTDDGAEEESIVLRFGRPVLAIAGGRAQLDFTDADSATWRARLLASAPQLKRAIDATGRVEVSNHPSGFPYMGTGWVIDQNVIVTNRHVALTFAERGDDGFKFLLGFDRVRSIGVDIDLLEEVGSEEQREFAIERVLYIARDDEPDFAFLKLADKGGPRPAPLALLTESVPANTMVAVVGYPAKDSRIPDQALMNQIFGGVFSRKRLSPGFASQPTPDAVTHDCTTLGGNSGSPVVDLATGSVAGLHYSGMFLKTNYGIPGGVLAQFLRRLRNGDLNAESSITTARTTGGTMSTMRSDELSKGGSEVTLTVPLTITVRLGQPGGDGTVTVTTGASSGGATATAGGIHEAVALARRQLGGRLDVVNIEAGWKFSGGWITDTRAVVVHVRNKKSPRALESLGVAPLPPTIGGVPVDVRPVPLRVHLEAIGMLEAPAATFVTDYTTDAAVKLKEQNEEMKVTVCHSPDAGWPVLEPFLAATEESLVIGMYDLTAPHIITGITHATKAAGRKLTLVLQRGQDIGKGTKADDLPEDDTVKELGDTLKKRFAFSWASVRFKGALFKSAYHIKVAVRDGTAFWLSSGNMQSSNQPDHDPVKDGDTSPPLLTANNRDWHAVVENEALAKIFQHYLERDRDMAEAHPSPDEAVDPMVWVSEDYFQGSEEELEARHQYFPALTVERKLRVQPLLTPDNYATHVLAFIKTAKKYIYFQNQSLKIGKDGQNPQHYQKLLDALLEKQQAGLDVRIIIRRIGDLEDTVSRIKDFGFDTGKLRLQTNCHTKGIIVDGKSVMLGSQNWTGDGTGPNRDASLIFYDPEITKYFERVFLYDWTRIGKPKINESIAAPELVSADESVPRPGMVQMPLSRWLGES